MALAHELQSLNRGQKQAVEWAYGQIGESTGLGLQGRRTFDGHAKCFEAGAERGAGDAESLGGLRQIAVGMLQDFG